VQSGKSEEKAETSTDDTIRARNGNELQNVDFVEDMKNLSVQGIPKSVKSVNNVKHILPIKCDCKIEGFGAIGLKSEFVKKA
jgi:protein PhnA